MTDKPKSQTKIKCLTCGAKIDAGDFEPDTTPLDPTYRGRAFRCPECGAFVFQPPKGDKPAD